MSALSVISFYRFVALPDYEALRAPLLELCTELGLCGSVLLAAEGINATLAGSAAGLQALLTYLESDARLANLELRRSTAEEPPFERMKVRLKREIVSMGVEGLDPHLGVGTYVEPAHWNHLIEDPEVVVVDVRNDMEVAIGSFRGARNPELKSFREFPAWLRAQFSAEENPRVAMFCTGGIRCEKSTAFLRQAGLEHVYHLKGGILAYLEQVPREESLWEGECYVFDKRVSLGHGLREGLHEHCLACGDPLSVAQRAQPEYERGISCPRCIGSSSALKRERLRARR